ncbi:TPA: HipA domain-containing protein [Escherichia coli]|nr:HipA domain-containing protein [Escherichia coli]
MPKLVTWMNNQRVGELTKLANGAHTFKYAPEWLASRYARPLSLSLPLQRGNITSDAVFMAFLMGSSEALKDRYDFMKFQVFQWLIGATDGHAKNFSVFIQAGGSYRLTPFYDIISAFPVLGGTGIHISDLKLAMGLNASKGKKTAIDKIYPRHFLATAKVLKFPEVQMHEILSDFARMIPAALDNVKTSLPTDFPENVVTAVETNVLRLHGRLSREYGIK